MSHLRRYLRSEVAQLHENGQRLIFIGERGRLPGDIVRLIEEAEKLTVGNEGMTVGIAPNYSTRREFVVAAQRLATVAAAGDVDPDRISEKDIAASLFTAEIPDPDLIIRTSGERRIGNFLLWQSAYSEYAFLDKYWPDFGKEDLQMAILKYSDR